MFLKLRFLLKVLTGVAQPVPFGQGQQFLPVHPQNLGAFVQNPSGMYFLNFVFFKRRLLCFSIATLPILKNDSVERAYVISRNLIWLECFVFFLGLHC